MSLFPKKVLFPHFFFVFIQKKLYLCMEFLINMNKLDG